MERLRVHNEEKSLGEFDIHRAREARGNINLSNASVSMNIRKRNTTTTGQVMESYDR